MAAHWAAELYAAVASLPPSAQSRASDRRVAPANGSDGVTGTAAAAHVMVVEDDRDTREVVKLILELEGIGVTEASDGFEALDRLHKLRAENPDLPCAVLLDLMMPRCSGTEFRKRQLQDPLISEVPVIVLSAIADQVRMEDFGPYANVSKPFDPDQLVRVVREACEGQHPTPPKPAHR